MGSALQPARLAKDRYAEIMDDEIASHSLLGEIWRACVHRKFLCLAVTTLVLMAACGVLLLLKPLYRGAADVSLNIRRTEAVEVVNVLSDLPATYDALITELQVLQSRSLVDRAVLKTGLDRIPEFNALLRPRTLIDDAVDNTIAALPDGMRQRVQTLVLGRAAFPQEPGVVMDMIYERVLKRLAVAPIGRSLVLHITFDSEDPALAASFANTLAELYIGDQLINKQVETDRANGWINERIANLKDVYDRSERQAEEYRVASGLFDGKESTLLREEISQTATQLGEARDQRMAAESRLQQVDRAVTNNPFGAAVAESLRSPIVTQLVLTLAQIDQRRADFSTRRGDLHPGTIALAAEARDTRTRIAEETAKVQASLRADLQGSINKERQLSARIDELKQGLGQAAKATIRLEELKREAESNRDLYMGFLRRSKETTPGQTYMVADARLVSSASTPLKPSFPNLLILLPAAFILATGTGAVTAVGADRMSRGLFSMSQVEWLGHQPLGLIPAVRQRPRVDNLSFAGDGKVAEPDATGLLAAAVGDLWMRLTLLSGRQGGPVRSLLVTSAIPQEGKTTTSLMLACKAARAGKRTLLIDADLRRSALRASLGTRRGPGLMDVLAGTVGAGEVIHAHDSLPLDLMPPGTLNHNAADLLRSDRMRQLIDGLNGAYDLVIVDTAPVMIAAETMILARLVDQTLFFIRWGKTPRMTALTALRQVEMAGGSIGGVVLSMVDARRNAAFGHAESILYSRKLRHYYAA
jgi:capsular exopolysaccharide synthesis family protein